MRIIRCKIVVNDPNKLSNNFNSDKSSSTSTSSNIISIKCTKELFSKEGLKIIFQVIS